MSQAIVPSAIGAVVIYGYHKMGYTYDGITTASEIKALDIVLGGLVAVLVGYYMGTVGFDGEGLLQGLIQGSAATAWYRLFSLAIGS